jgi:uncharacterized protein involved in cysteine biosynthesis
MNELVEPSASGKAVTVVEVKPGIRATFREAFDAYRTANRLIWGGGLWRYWVIPALLAVAYLPLLVLGIAWASDWLAGHMKWSGAEGSWSWWLWRVMWWGVLGVVGWLTYRSVVLLFHAPFLDVISERVEKDLTGRDEAPDVKWVSMAWRSVRMAAVIGGLSMIVAVLNFGVTLIPVLGWLVSIGILLPVQLWLGGAQALDPYLGRNGDGARASLRRMRRRPLLVLLLGAGGALILLIPVLGWFVGPTYLVVAGVVTGVRMTRTGNGGAS